MTIHFDQGALAALLHSETSDALVKRVADEIALKVEAQRVMVGGVGVNEGGDQIPLPVEVSVFTVDGHSQAAVDLAHPAGIAAQAKYGLLTRAAAAVGLHVQG